MLFANDDIQNMPRVLGGMGEGYKWKGSRILVRIFMPLW